MTGDKLTALNSGFSNYKVYLYQEEHLEDNPNFNCKNYLHPGYYHKCLENGIIKEFKKMVNCTPPWATDNEVGF